jgi:hypothetical protein
LIGAASFIFERRFIMPNWCNNTLRVTGPKADVARFKKQAVGHSPWPKVSQNAEALNFHSLVPIPAQVLSAGYEAAGYDWERDNWGCKWGACNPELLDDSDRELLYQFDTAWSPPITFLGSAAKQWPTLNFVMEYEEGGMGFKGVAEAQGETIEDQCTSL